MVNYEKIRAMDTASLRSLNNAIVHELRQRHAEEARKLAAAFRPGDLAQFTDKRGNRRLLRIEKFNTKTVSGVEVDRVTLKPGPIRMNWRVSPSLLTRYVAAIPGARSASPALM